MHTAVLARRWKTMIVTGWVVGAMLAVLAPAAEAGRTSTSQAAELTIIETPAVAGDGHPYSATLLNDTTDYFIMGLPKGRSFWVDIPGVGPGGGTREVCSVPSKGTGQNTIIGIGGDWLDKDYSTGAVVSTEVLGQIKCVSGGVQYELQYFDEWSDTVHDYCAVLSSTNGQSWIFSADENCLANVRKGSNRTLIARGAAPFNMTLSRK